MAKSTPNTDANLPSITPERALSAFQKHYVSLAALRGRNYQEADQDEEEWKLFTESLTERAFGNSSSNLHKYYGARSAGNYNAFRRGSPVPHERRQSNFEARLQAYEAFMKSCISELELMLPEKDLVGHYEPGQEYEFYRDLKSISERANNNILIVEPYIAAEVIDVYLGSVSRSVQIGILTASIPQVVLTVAQKYATGGNLQVRTTNGIHDRVVFVDDRVWMVGQSLKDAAKKKPTYIVEHDAALVRPAYDNIWRAATRAV